MKDQQASPELCKFFDRLSELKNYIKEKILNSSDLEVVAELEIIYNRLHDFFKTKEETEEKDV